MLCEGNKGWAVIKKDYQYLGWQSGSGTVGDYYLEVRLDAALQNLQFLWRVIGTLIKSNYEGDCSFCNPLY